jgi:hypothetical protein
MNATQQTNPKADEIAETLVSLGRDWASYGLRLAKMALEQSAGTLGKVATALDGIREQVETKGAKPAADAPKTQTQAP